MDTPLPNPGSQCFAPTSGHGKCYTVHNDGNYTDPISLTTALATSPNYRRDRTLFAATSAGPAVSRDGGASFNAWNEGLGPTPVVALAVSPAYQRDRLVYALGLGGTVWRRRDG